MTAGRWGARFDNAWDYGRFALLAGAAGALFGSTYGIGAGVGVGTAFLAACAGVHGLAWVTLRASRRSGVPQRQVPGSNA